MIRSLIIDDEQHCIDRIKNLCEEHLSKQVHIMDSFYNAEDGLKAIRKYKPALVFLDVQLDGGKTAFDILKQLEQIDFDVIFTTAYEKYAVQAFKFSALDYLLKPIDADDLKQAVAKLLDKNPKIETTQKLETLLGNLYGTSKRICVPVVNGLIVLKIEDIIRCESDINYTTIFMRDKQKLTVAKVLKEFEEMLSDFNFFRIHNSHLVNLAYIKSYNRGKGGTVTMIDGMEIEVSTRRKDDFLKKLTEI
ncbi:MAG: LytTR family DNA-binding domain-containing protein [Bacteroidota bacterium]